MIKLITPWGMLVTVALLAVITMNAQGLERLHPGILQGALSGACQPDLEPLRVETDVGIEQLMPQLLIPGETV